MPIHYFVKILCKKAKRTTPNAFLQDKLLHGDISTKLFSLDITSSIINKVFRFFNSPIGFMSGDGLLPIESDSRFCSLVNGAILEIELSDMNSILNCVISDMASMPELELLALQAESNYDLVFLCGDDIPYDNTWDRSGDVKRHIFQEHIVADLKERKIPYIELRGTLEGRIKKVESVLNNFNKYSIDELR